MGKILDRQRILQAVSALARKLQLPNEVTIISERGNLVARLGESDVIVRAIYLNAFIYRDPIYWMQQEVDIARLLLKRGVDCISPHPDLPPGPHHEHDVPMTLWRRIDPANELSSPIAVADHLRAFHQTSRNIDVPLPWLTPLTQLIPQTLDALAENNALEPRYLKALWGEYQRLFDALDAGSTRSTVIHGDAHVGNLLSDGERWVWTDLEDVCRGPVEWDLACLHGSRRLNGAEAVKRYVSSDPEQSIDMTVLSLCHDARELEASVWLVAMAYQRPDRYQDLAAEFLDRLMRRLGH